MKTIVETYVPRDDPNTTRVLVTNSQWQDLGVREFPSLQDAMETLFRENRKHNLVVCRNKEVKFLVLGPDSNTTTVYERYVDYEYVVQIYDGYLE